MSGRIATITFFSGTGNTRHACALLAAGLERAGWRVGLREIAPPRGEGQGGRAAPGAGARQPDLAVFAFPVYALGTPHLFRMFLQRLPRVGGTPAAVLAVYGDVLAGPPSSWQLAAGYEGGALDEARKLLARRGYDVRTTRAVGFPASVTQLWPPPLPVEQRILLAGSEKAMAAMAADLAAGKPTLQSRRPVVRALSVVFRFLFSLVGRRALGKMYIADERCTSCGWCERACPAAAIRMRGRGGARRLPHWGWQCEACQRCINGCPEACIQVSAARLLLLAAVAFLPYARWLAAAAPGISFPGVGIAAWLAGAFIATVAMDQLLRLLECVSGVRRLLWLSHTRRFPRYAGPPH